MSRHPPSEALALILERFCIIVIYRFFYQLLMLFAQFPLLNVFASALAAYAHLALWAAHALTQSRQWSTDPHPPPFQLST